MKKRIFVIVILAMIIVLYIIYIINNKQEEILKEKPIETILCKFSKVEYSFDIYFDEDNLFYKSSTNSSLSEPFKYKTEEEINNVIKSIYESKGAKCETTYNLDIKLDL